VALVKHEVLRSKLAECVECLVCGKLSAGRDEGRVPQRLEATRSIPRDTRYQRLERTGVSRTARYEACRTSREETGRHYTSGFSRNGAVETADVTDVRVALALQNVIMAEVVC
jgi:hypothetical protein